MFIPGVIDSSSESVRIALDHVAYFYVAPSGAQFQIFAYVAGVTDVLRVGGTYNTEVLAFAAIDTLVKATQGLGSV